MKHNQAINFVDFSVFDDVVKKSADVISNIRIVFKLPKASVYL